MNIPESIFTATRPLFRSSAATAIEDSIAIAGRLSVDKCPEGRSFYCVVEDVFLRINGMYDEQTKKHSAKCAIPKSIRPINGHKQSINFPVGFSKKRFTSSVNS